MAILLALLAMPAGLCLSAPVVPNGIDTRYRFRHITDRNGLKYSWIWNIDQDSRGYLWFSTMYGTYRYDGYEFEEYAFPNRTNGTAVNVTFVVEDRTGDLWFGTDDGLYRHDRRYNHYVCYASSEQSPCRLSSDDILAAALGSDDVLWVGTGNGLNRISADRKSCTIVPLQGGFTVVTSVVCRSDGSVWVGDNGGGVWRVEEGVKPVRIALDAGPNAVKLYEDSRQRLWIASEGAGLFRLGEDGRAVKFCERDATLSNDIVRMVCEDAEGSVWAATERGITIVSDEGIEYLYRQENDLWGLNDNAVYSLCRDRDGTMWVGTFFGGINVMNDRYGMFGDPIPAGSLNVLKGCAVSCIASDRDRIYVGTENRGLFVCDASTGRMSNYDSRTGGLANDNVHAVCIDDRKRVWVGNFYGGLSCMYAGGSRFTPESAAAIPSNSVYCIRQDRAGTLWVGTRYGGLCRYDYTTGRFSRVESLPEWLFVWDIEEDYKGNIWLACYGDGIWKLDRARGYRPVQVETGARLYITLCELSDGRMLAGTEKEGLTAVGIDDLSVKRHTSAEGLPDDTIYGILQDAFGNVWFSSNSGIYKSDVHLSRFTNYTVADGLPTNRFNYNACARIGDKLWFGSTDGVVTIDPAREGAPAAGRPIRFSNLYIYNEKQRVDARTKGSVLPEELASIDELVLRSNRLTWGVDFTCNTFDNNAVHYAYRLGGMDDAWHALGTQHRIDFTGLGYGRYRLTVCTLDAEGAPTDNRCSLAVFIRPPWWRSLAAKFAYLLLSLALTGYLIWLLMNNARTRHAFELERLEREKDREINEMKLRFFVNVSHEFKTPLSLIIGPVNSFLEGNVPAALREKYLNIVRRNAEKLLGLINELLAFRELEHVKLRIRPFYLRAFVESALNRHGWLLESKNIRVDDVDFNEGLVVWADIDKFEKVVDNLLSNACKYTPVGGRVCVDAGGDDRGVWMSVTNTGPGISPEKLPRIFERFFTGHTYDRYSSGVGLSYVKSLMELHDGEITVESRENEYTRFTLRLPERSDEREFRPVDIARYSLEAFDESHLAPDAEGDVEDDAYLEMERQTTVLVVEDDTDMRALLVESLRGRFRTESAANAAGALEIIAANRIDVLVTDVMMGEGMSGFELCKTVKTNIETSHIRVVLTTVLSENNYRERGYKSGADAYVVKPFEFSLLALRIRNLIYNAWKAREAYKIDIDLSNVDITHSDSDEQLLRRAVSLVFDRLADSEFNVDDLCSGLNMSQSTLYRKLKVTTGQSINEFIQNIRLKYAARLLRETSRTVSEITFDVGFTDSSYFSRAFRKCFGVSPKQWRGQTADDADELAL